MSGNEFACSLGSSSAKITWCEHKKRVEKCWRITCADIRPGVYGPLGYYCTWLTWYMPKIIMLPLIASWVVRRYTAIIALRAFRVRILAWGPFPIPYPSLSPTAFPVLSTLSYQIKGKINNNFFFFLTNCGCFGNLVMPWYFVHVLWYTWKYHGVPYKIQYSNPSNQSTIVLLSLYHGTTTLLFCKGCRICVVLFPKIPYSSQCYYSTFLQLVWQW